MAQETIQRTRSESGLRRLDMVGVRTGLAAAAGLVAGIVASWFIVWQAAVLVGWVVTAACNLLWTWLIVARLDPEATKAHANVEDPSQGLSETLVIVAGVALLAAVGLLLIRAGQAHGSTKAYLITIGVLAVIASWSTVHTVFTLRYTRTYYRGEPGGVDFNEDDPPAYLDFAYLAFTIGMTFQVSDTDLGTKPIRRIALGHALLSYLFGAMIVALSINVVAGLLQ
jgi:uncharacterized membrane protein